MEHPGSGLQRSPITHRPLSLGKPVIVIVAALVAAACSNDRITDTRSATPKASSFTSIAGNRPYVVDVSRDTTAQNETPLAVNPLNTDNLLTGSNDWNYNDGCCVNASFDGGKSGKVSF